LHLPTRSAPDLKIITRHIWEDTKERIDHHRLNPAGQKIYRRRKEMVERSFADAKELHGYRYARYRVAEPCQKSVFTGGCRTEYEENSIDEQ